MRHGPVFILNRNTPAYRRADAAGFEFGPPEGVYSEGGRYWEVRWVFSCVCGQQEAARFLLDGLVLVHGHRSPYLSVHSTPVGHLVLIDCAAMLEDIGAFSVEHLRQDGYTEEQIQSIRAPWDAEVAH